MGWAATGALALGAVVRGELAMVGAQKNRDGHAEGPRVK